MGTVVELLILIAVLVCVKQEERGSVLAFVLLIVGGVYGLHWLFPFLTAVGALVLEWCGNVIGLLPSLALLLASPALLILLVLIGVLGWLGWLDAKENKAIRAGSEEAFNKRVHVYINELNYTPEKAIEVTTRIRDGKREKAPEPSRHL